MSEPPVYAIDPSMRLSWITISASNCVACHATWPPASRRPSMACAPIPGPVGCKHLAGYGHLHRVRVGDWRIIYEVQDQQLLVLVIEAAARGSAYRGL